MTLIFTDFILLMKFRSQSAICLISAINSFKLLLLVQLLCSLLFLKSSYRDIFPIKVSNIWNAKTAVGIYTITHIWCVNDWIRRFFAGNDYLIIAYGIANGVSYAFLLICFVLCIEILLLASRFMVNRAGKFIVLIVIENHSLKSYSSDQRTERGGSEKRFQSTLL
jgi:hypothetical protein